MAEIINFPANEEFKTYAESVQNMNEIAINIIKMFVSRMSSSMTQTDFEKFFSEYVITCKQYVQALDNIEQAYKVAQNEVSD